jgi:osmotically-inducible protein OsmY
MLLNCIATGMIFSAFLLHFSLQKFVYMSYRNRHQLHRSDQVWNRDLMHSDEEDLAPRSAATGYSPGYSNRQSLQSNSYPQGSDYGDYNQSFNRDRNYNDNRNDRYDSDRWNSDRGRYDNRGSSYDSGRFYDYDSGELRNRYRSDVDRSSYNRSYDRDRNYITDRNYNQYRGDNDRDWWDRSKDEVKSWFGDDDAERRRDRDRQMNHRGKGPKGYQRSDERIREDVSDRLSDDDRVDASDIEIDVNNCEVVLKGSVNTRDEKRRAEDLAESVSGVKNVENRLRCTNPNGGINMNRYTGTTGDFTGIGSSSGTTSEIMRDVRNSQQDRW